MSILYGYGGAMCAMAQQTTTFVEFILSFHLSESSREQTQAVRVMQQALWATELSLWPHSINFEAFKTATKIFTKEGMPQGAFE